MFSLYVEFKTNKLEKDQICGYQRRGVVQTEGRIDCKAEVEF